MYIYKNIYIYSLRAQGRREGGGARRPEGAAGGSGSTSGSRPAPWCGRGLAQPKGAEGAAAILWRERGAGSRQPSASAFSGGAAAIMLSARVAAALARSLPRQAGLVSELSPP